MIPILYPANETAFTTNGLGRLTDALTCTVVEEVNEVYELSMTYPLDGIHLNDMQVNMIIYAKPSFGRLPQPFRIREIVKSWGNRVSITARHVKNELSSYAVSQFGNRPNTGYSTDPILYGPDHKVIAPLTQTLSKSITKSGNVYTLNMSYPINGPHASQITTSAYIYMQPEVGKSMAEFDITAVTTTTATIKITAKRTGSSDAPIALNQMNVSEALASIEAYTINPVGSTKFPYPFTFSAAPDTPGDTWSTQLKEFKNEYPVQANELIGSDEGRIVDLYGGEWEWDHYHCILHEHRGRESGVIYKYGKNITDINATTNIDEFYTHAVSYWKGSMSSSTNTDYTNNNYSEYTVTTGTAIKAMSDEYDAMFPSMKVMILDASSEFDEQPTVAQLDDYTNWYIANNDVGIPRVTIKVDVVDLASTEEYKDYAPLETVQLCDYVTVIFPEFGVDVKEQISRIEYNVLTDKNTSVTIGETKLTLADYLASTKGKLRRNKYDDQKWADRCAERAIRASSGWYGGNIKKVYNKSDHKQQAAYCMDSDNEDTASHVLKADGSGVSGGTNGTRGEMDSIISLNNPHGEVGVNGSKVNYGKLAAQGKSTRYFDLDSGKSEMIFGDDKIFATDDGFKAITTGTDGLVVDDEATKITGRLVITSDDRETKITIKKAKIIIGEPNDVTKVTFQDIEDLKAFLDELGGMAGDMSSIQNELDDHERRIQALENS